LWTTSPGTLRPFNSFLILLNLEKDFSPEQFVTIKLKNNRVGEEFCSCQLAKWLLLAIEAHQDLL